MAARARRAASTAASPVCLPPNPPPVSGTITRTLSADSEGSGQLAADAEGILAAGPYRELVAVPLGHGGPGLHRRVLDIGDLVAFVEDLFCAGQVRLQRAGERGPGGCAMGEKVLAGDLCARSSTWPSWTGPRRPAGLPGWSARRSRPAASCTTVTPARAWAGARSIDASVRRRRAGGGFCRGASPAERCRTDSDAPR